MYTTCACNNDHLVKLADPVKDLLNGFLKDVHSGKLTEDSIHPDYYKTLAAKLTEAVGKGLGGVSFGADDFRNSLKAYLDENIYAFSGAKSLVMLQEFNKLLRDENGNTVSFAEFKSRIAKTHELYNVHHLEAEYNNAIASAQMAEKWEGLKQFPLLEYRTVGDNRVRPEHKALDGLILKSSDPIWNRIYPPNDWNCRCTVIPAGSTAERTDRDVVKQREKIADIPPYFKKNVGQEQTVFRDDHPYMRNKKSRHYKEFDAEKNYGMKSMQQIYADDLPEMIFKNSKQDALDWWNKKTEGEKHFDVKAADGLTVRLDKRFRDHVLEQNSDNRWRFLHTAPEVLQNPDEIWTRRIDGSVSVSYIKYYDHAPVVLHVDADGTVRGATLFEASKDGKINVTEMQKIRKGQLKFKK